MEDADEDFISAAKSESSPANMENFNLFGVPLNQLDVGDDPKNFKEKNKKR